MADSTTALGENTPSPCGRPLLYAAENLSFYHALEEPNQGKAHCHDDIQIALPMSELLHTTRQTSSGRRVRQTITPGSFSLTASGQTHLVELRQRTELAVVWLPFQFLARIADEMGVSRPVEITDCGRPRDMLLQQLCITLLPELRQNAAPARLYIDSIANLLAARLIRQHTTWGSAAEKPTGGLSPRRLRLVLSYIQEHLGQDIALADLAEAAGLSSSHFSPLFRHSVGLTPYQYVLSRRIEWAKDLLRAGRLSIGEIALQVGFCDQSQFTRQFKQQVGLTPRAFIQAAS